MAKSNIDRNPSFVFHFGSHGQTMRYAGQTFELTGLSLKDAATVRYNIILNLFGKASADAMVEGYAAEPQEAA